MLAPARRSLLVAVMLLAIAVLALHPRTAHATTYCLKDPTCAAIAGNDTTYESSGDLSAAVTTANMGTGNTISLGAGTFPISSYLATSATGTTVKGAGQGATIILTTANSGLGIHSAGSTVRDLTVQLDATASSGLSLSSTSSASNVSVLGATSSSATGVNLIIVSDGTVTMDHVTATGPLSCDVNGYSALLAGPTSQTTTLTATDSSFTACYGANIESGANHSTSATFSRDRVTGHDYGIYEYGYSGNASIIASSSLIRATGASTYGTTAVYVAGGGSSTASTHLTSDTVIDDSPPPSHTPVSANPNQGIVSTAAGGTGMGAVVIVRSIVDVSNGNVITRADGGSATPSTFSGTFLDLVGDADGSKNVGTNIVPSNVIGTAVPYVDAANGNFRPLWNSETIDFGSNASLVAGESTTDLLGQPRPVSGPGHTMAYADLGAYEYQHAAPTVALTSAPTAGTVGVPMTYSAVGADTDPGETTALTYLWALPDGTFAHTASVTFTPASAGTVTLGLVVSDPSGLSVNPPVPTLTVSPAPVITPPAPTPVDTGTPVAVTPIAPAVTPIVANEVFTGHPVTFVALTAKLSTLLAAKPFTLTGTVSTALRIRAVLVATATTVTKVEGKRHVKTTKIIISTSTASTTSAAKVMLPFRASKSVAAKLKALAKVKGTTIRYTLTTTGTSATGVSLVSVSVLRVR